MPFFIVIAIWACVAGLICFLINRAPFIDAPYKQFANWFVLAGFIIWVALVLTGNATTPVIYTH